MSSALVFDESQEVWCQPQCFAKPVKAKVPSWPVTPVSMVRNLKNCDQNEEKRDSNSNCTIFRVEFNVEIQNAFHFQLRSQLTTILSFSSLILLRCGEHFFLLCVFVSEVFWVSCCKDGSRFVSRALKWISWIKKPERNKETSRLFTRITRVPKSKVFPDRVVCLQIDKKKK